VAIELTLHQPIHQVDHGDLGSELGQPRRGLQPEQAAADDNDLGKPGRRRLNRSDIAKVAEGHHTGQIHPRHAEPNWA
jgi:hypothetical protein